MALRDRQIIAFWLKYFAYGAGIIYLLAQSELLATVMPHAFVWADAGLIGSTMWFACMIAVGIGFLRHGRNGVD
jgi:hypothetical protein